MYLLQVLPFYSCSLEEEAEAEAASACAQPPSEALAQVTPHLEFLTVTVLLL